MAKAKILSGSHVVESMNLKTTKESGELRLLGVEPLLAIIRVGNREDALAYENGAKKRCHIVGVSTKTVNFSSEISEDELIDAINALNEDNSVHGVLILRPLPAHIDDDRVRNKLVAHKDIDGITDISTATVFTGASSGFSPCTPQACIEILDHYGFEIRGKRVVVIGRSLVIGRPLAMKFLQRDATVTICHSQSVDLCNVVKQADIVAACIGQPKMIDSRFLRPDQVVIDVGINFTNEGTMVGDVDFEQASQIVSAITPVPGGVGAVTTSVLAKHVVEAAKKQLSKV